MNDALARKAIAKRAGLPDTATWEEIQEADTEFDAGELRVIGLIADLLGLPRGGDA